MDPLQPQVAPAPESPVAVPGIPEAAPELSQEEMKANLQEMMAKLDSKKQEFDTQNFTSQSQEEQQKSEAMAQLFDILQSKGIDPNDPEAVKAFLDDIKSKNPELYQQVVQALEVLLGDQIAPEGGQEVAPEAAPVEEAPANMNINPNEEVPQNI